MSESGELSRFVGRVHRRQIALRLLEQAGIGAALGAAAAMAAANRMENVFLLVGMGALMGSLLGWLNRPTRMKSAMEADRQLGLKELLSSALSSNNPADPWQRAVAADAQRRIRGLSPWGLRLRKLGAGGWCVIGGMVLLSMGFGLMSDTPPNAQASAGRQVFMNREELNRPENWLAKRTDTASTEAPPTSPNGSSVDEMPHHPSDNNEGDVQKLGSGSSTEHASAGSADQPGMGSAQTESPESSKPTSPDAGHSRRDEPNGRPAGGTGDPADHAGGNLGQGALAGGNGSPSEPSPPWHGNQWESDQQTAMQATQNGRIPGRYRALVRAYFSIDHQ